MYTDAATPHKGGTVVNSELVQAAELVVVTPLIAGPGSHFAYSNLAWQAVPVAVEAAACRTGRRLTRSWDGRQDSTGCEYASIALALRLLVSNWVLRANLPHRMPSVDTVGELEVSSGGGDSANVNRQQGGIAPAADYATFAAMVASGGLATDGSRVLR